MKARKGREELQEPLLVREHPDDDLHDAAAEAGVGRVSSADAEGDAHSRTGGADAALLERSAITDQGAARRTWNTLMRRAATDIRGGEWSSSEEEADEADRAGARRGHEAAPPRASRQLGTDVVAPQGVAEHTARTGHLGARVTRAADARRCDSESIPCFSVFSEAVRWGRRLGAAALSTSGDDGTEAVMFPATPARWGSVTEESLKALDLSWGEGADSPRESPSSWRPPLAGRVYRGVFGLESLGVRMIRALRESAQGVRFRHRVSMALGLQEDDDNYKRYFSKKFRESGRGGERLVVCLPMRICEIGASGAGRERTDLNQLGLLREIFRQMRRPPRRLAAILNPSNFADLSHLPPLSGDTFSERSLAPDEFAHAPASRRSQLGGGVRKGEVQGGEVAEAEEYKGQGEAGVAGQLPRTRVGDGDGRVRKGARRGGGDVFFHMTPLEMGRGEGVVGRGGDGGTGMSAGGGEYGHPLRRLGLGDLRALQPLGVLYSCVLSVCVGMCAYVCMCECMCLCVVKFEVCICVCKERVGCEGVSMEGVKFGVCVCVCEERDV
jgi:hypothetical protein